MTITKNISRHRKYFKSHYCYRDDSDHQDYQRAVSAALQGKPNSGHAPRASNNRSSARSRSSCTSTIIQFHPFFRMPRSFPRKCFGKRPSLGAVDGGRRMVINRFWNKGAQREPMTAAAPRGKCYRLIGVLSATVLVSRLLRLRPLSLADPPIHFFAFRFRERQRAFAGFPRTFLRHSRPSPP